MTIRTYWAGDEEAQVAIYNAAAASQPKFKPVTLGEVFRRIRSAEFDPEARFFAEQAGHVVGYATFHANGRVSYPWCLPGHQEHAEPLFEAVISAAKARGLRLLFAAYREDWPAINQFFLRKGFSQAREMVNYRLPLGNMPTAEVRPGKKITELRPDDIPAVLRLYPEALRVATPEALHQHLFENPYFSAADLFAWRIRPSATALAAGILITNSAYADPASVDPNVPCFRLGAFGTEGMQVKRLKGLFSFLTPPGQALTAIGMDMLAHAANRLTETDDIDTFATQVPSDAPALLAFFENHFERQGGFPVLERELA